MSFSVDTVSPSRQIALQHLERVERDDAFVGRLQAEHADARSHRQARELVAGVTRQRRWLDFILATAYDGDYTSIESRLRQILRLGLYELLFQSTPTRAVVHEYVELAKHTLRQGAGNLVNGVLRALDRRDALPEPSTGSAAENLAIRHSHPTWMVERWLERFGEAETRELLRWNNRRPAHHVRINPQRTGLEDVEAWLDRHDVVYTRSSYLEDWLRVKRLQTLVQEGVLKDGTVAVQDESAGLVVRLLDPTPGETIVDGCAAPGGKTLTIGASMNGRGCVHAVDTHEGRLSRLRESAKAHGVDHLISTETADLRTMAERPDPPQADRVLVDVPCTGLGTLAKRADLRWRRTPDDFEELTSLQNDLLTAAARFVRPGGCLVYSTCTIAPEENEERIDAFLDGRDDFVLESAAEELPAEVVSECGMLRTLPQRHGMDGAYGCRLRHVGS